MTGDWLRAVRNQLLAPELNGHFEGLVAPSNLPRCVGACSGRLRCCIAGYVISMGMKGAASGPWLCPRTTEGQTQVPIQRSCFDPAGALSRERVLYVPIYTSCKSSCSFQGYMMSMRAVLGQVVRQICSKVSLEGFPLIEV